MIHCDRCRVLFSSAVPRSDNPDQALCAGCCAHLRAGGTWALGSPTPGAPPPCPPEFLPLRAHLDFGATPLFPTESNFHLAASDVARTGEPAARWRLEAIRERRQRPGAPLDGPTLQVIGERAAGRGRP